MEHIEQKIIFLKSDFARHLRKLEPSSRPLFGKMNPHQMVEHMAEYIRLAYGNPIIAEPAYNQEVLAKMNAFLKTEKPLRPNTANPLMEETPAATKLENFESAIKDAEKAIAEFFVAFEQNPSLEISNPFFGVLDYTLSIQLLYKHGKHHLAQFGIVE